MLNRRYVPPNKGSQARQTPNHLNIKVFDKNKRFANGVAVAEISHMYALVEVGLIFEWSNSKLLHQLGSRARTISTFADVLIRGPHQPLLRNKYANSTSKI